MDDCLDDTPDRVSSVRNIRLILPACSSIAAEPTLVEARAALGSGRARSVSV